MSDKEKENTTAPLQPQIVYVQPSAAPQDDETEIDLGRVLSIFWDRKALAAKLSFGLAAVFLLGSLVMPKTYESTTVVQTSSTGAVLSGGAAALAALAGGSTNTEASNYIELMKSRRVIGPILENVEFEDGFFSTAEEKKARTMANMGTWIEKNLKIENSKGTNLITITASAGTPEKAQEISQAVADNFLVMQTDLNQKQQSLLLNFLNERINTSKKEAEEADQKFSDYQKQHKVYSPEEQAKAAITKLDAYDKSLADLKVQQEAAKAAAATATAKLEQINMNSQSFQINDNAVVGKMRDQIATKQVELVTLQQQFTDEHPDVIKAKAELDQLKANLRKEVDDIVTSQAVTLNPQQASLLQREAEAEVQDAVAQASEEAVQSKRSEEEKKMENFPDDVRVYMELKRDAEIKNQVYAALVQQSEATRIEEAKQSMDIQVVDPANLPLEDMPSSPRKGRNAAIGFVLGLLISFGYAFYIYWQEARLAKD